MTEFHGFRLYNVIPMYLIGEYSAVKFPVLGARPLEAGLLLSCACLLISAPISFLSLKYIELPFGNLSKKVSEQIWKREPKQITTV